LSWFLLVLMCFAHVNLLPVFLYYVLDSWRVNNLTGCTIWSDSFSALLISVSKTSFCVSSFGLNAFPKRPAKVLAFSLLFRAQVWSAFLINGMSCLGRFNLLVAFQRQ
jgi:hypothetical protein